MFGRLGTASRGTRSFYEQLRAHDDNDDLEQQFGNDVDEENFRQQLDDLTTDDIGDGGSHVTTASVAFGGHETHGKPPFGSRRGSLSRWKGHDDEIDNDVPESLLVEPNETDLHATAAREQDAQHSPRTNRRPRAGPSTTRTRAQWEAATAQQPLHHEPKTTTLQQRLQPRSLLAGRVPGGAKEKAHWRWVNTSNLDSFMRDVYDYFEGGGLWCILCTNALWLL